VLQSTGRGRKRKNDIAEELVQKTREEIGQGVLPALMIDAAKKEKINEKEMVRKTTRQREQRDEEQTAHLQRSEWGRKWK
jgi:hypothetical protein